MNKTIKETKEFFEKFNKLVSKTKNEILIFPSFICLSAAKEKALKKISIGAQNVFFEEKGAFTGEISVLQLKGLCDFVLLGHSERRHKFFESDELINKKLVNAVKSLNVILCVGETKEENEKGRTNSVLERQLIKGLSGVSFSEKLFIAYEPVWAIGAGKNAGKKEINSAHFFIRKKLIELFGEKGKFIQILYGGSVNKENLNEVFSAENVNGVLVGGASLNPETFAEIANFKLK